MIPETDMMKRKKVLKTMEKCPKCGGTDLMVLPGSQTTYYACKNRECPNNKPPINDNQKAGSTNNNN